MLAVPRPLWLLDEPSVGLDVEVMHKNVLLNLYICAYMLALDFGFAELLI